MLRAFPIPEALVRTLQILCAALALALALAAPASAAGKSSRPAADDLDLDLDAPAAPKKADKKKKSTAKPAADLDLDAPPPPPAAKAADGGFDLDLGLDESPVKVPAKAATPAPTPTPAPTTAPLAAPAKAAPAALAPTPAPQTAPRDPASNEETEGAGVLDAIGPFHAFELGLKLGGLVFAGRTNDALIGAGLLPSANRGFTVPTMLEARWRPTESLPELAATFEAGLFPKSGAVMRELPFDPDFKATTSSYFILAVPLALGVTYDLPFKLNFDTIGFALRASLLGQYTRSTGTWTTGGVTVENATQSGFALGWLAGAEMTVLAGPGAVVVDLRYAQAFTDLGLRTAYAANGAQAEQPYNRAAMGDVQGTNVLAGYRLLF